MQEVFEKIIEKLEELKKSELEREDLCDEEGCGDGEEIYEDGKSAGRYEQIVRIIEIVKQAAEECKHGHFGCNSNGQHEKCSSCCDYDCKNRNSEWFGVNDEEKKRTNADRIRSMTDTELRLFICEIADCKRCPCHDMCIEYGMGTGIQKWLQSEVEEQHGFRKQKAKSEKQLYA